jgi:hypothetical protein
MYIKLFLFILIIIALFSISCTEEKGNSVFVPDTTFHGDTISYSRTIQPIFNRECISCHANPYADGELDLTNWSNAMTTGRHNPVIIPFEPESSYLFMKISGSDHDNSPFNSERVLNPIYYWIQEGALDN